MEKGGGASPPLLCNILCYISKYYNLLCYITIYYNLLCYITIYYNTLQYISYSVTPCIVLHGRRQ